MATWLIGGGAAMDQMIEKTDILKVYAVVREAGSISLLDLIARCSITPDALLQSLRRLQEDGMIEVAGAGDVDVIGDATTVLAEVAPDRSWQAPETVRSNLFFALHDKYQDLAKAPFSPAF